jgi:hypothetical protein
VASLRADHTRFRKIHSSLLCSSNQVLTKRQYRVLGYDDLTGRHSDLAVALKFAPKVFGAATGLKICMALSALGNIVAVTYTASKGIFLY